MKTMRFNQMNHPIRLWLWVLSAGLYLYAIGIWGTAQAAGFKSPEECTAYTGDAHLNCLYAYIEIQKGKLEKFDDELKAQRGALRQLGDQVDRQGSVTDELQRRMDRPAVAPPSPPVYGYPPVAGGYYGYPPMLGVYGYPAPGISFYVGPRFYYGPPYYFYYHRFWGPRGHRR